MNSKAISKMQMQHNIWAIKETLAQIIAAGNRIQEVIKLRDCLHFNDSVLFHRGFRCTHFNDITGDTNDLFVKL